MSGDLVVPDPHAREAELVAATLDSRSVTAGSLFFALPGERTDGHRFLAQAVRRGAVGAVVERARFEAACAELEADALRAVLGLPRIEVDNCLEALHALTRAVRTTTPEHLVAITGSAGKTTTKELLGAMLATRFRVATSPGNFNTLFGFPIALLAIADDTEWMVAEMGMSTPGELKAVSRLGRPDVAVLTNVRLAHLEAFDSSAAPAGRFEIAESKAGLFEGLSETGLIVANSADSEVVRITRRHMSQHPRVRVAWFALEPEKAVAPPLLVASEIEPVEMGAGARGSRFLLERAIDAGAAEGDNVGSCDSAEDHDAVLVSLPLHGTVNVENFLAAATCAASLGVSLEEIALSARGARALAGRGELVELARGARLIDDSYNSNPDALRRALEAAAAVPAQRRWAVIGAMLELGRSSPQLHREAGRVAVEAGFSPLIVVGGEARELAAAATEHGGEATFFQHARDAAASAAGLLQPGDLVLVKGSRGVGLERVVVELIAAGGGRRVGGN